MTDQELLRLLDCRPAANVIIQQAEALVNGEVPGREAAVDPQVKKKRADDARRQRYFDHLLADVNSGRGWGW